jgi:hypothetical protein
MKPLYGFGGKRIKPVRVITLPVSFCMLENSRIEHIFFAVMCSVREFSSIQNGVVGMQIELIQFLDKNNNVFAWSTSDIIGVAREAIEDKLQVNPNAKPKKQKLHCWRS